MYRNIIKNNSNSSPPKSVTRAPKIGTYDPYTKVTHSSRSIVTHHTGSIVTNFRLNTSPLC